MRPVTYAVQYHSSRLQEELLAWPAGLQARYLRLVERIEWVGPNLGMTHTRSLGNGLFELRVKAKEGIGRVFFCAIAGRQVVMLHQFVKKSEKTPVRELDMARQRMREWMDAYAR